MKGFTPAEDTLRAAAAIKAGIIRQLIDAATFLEMTPGVVVDQNAPTDLYRFADSTAEVDALAAAIGEPAAWNSDHTHYRAVRAFGPTVRYKAIYIVPEPEADGTDEHCVPAGPVQAVAA